MTSLCDGITLSDSNEKVANSQNSQPPASNKGKRKAQEAQQAPASENKKMKVEDSAPVEEDKENVSPPSTPKGQALQPPAEMKAEPKEHEKTPGRVGPIKRTSFSVSPDIKPFKGPPGKKVRKTWYEKEEEYKQFIRDNELHPFHDLYVCFDKGPNGSPTYDKAGFELDYNKVADWMKPKSYNKGSIVRGMERSIEKRRQETMKMAEIFFEKGEGPEDPAQAQGADFWKDRVSKDLNVPWHRIGVEHFLEWERKGFKKARRGEYENFSAAEKERMSKLHEGCTLRK